jgi:predicted PurR-regulated permease PerM
MNNGHSLTISFKTVFYTLASAGVLYLLYSSTDVLLTLVLSIVIVLSIEPLVKELLKIRLFGKSPFKRTSAVLISYLLVFFLVIISFVYAIPEVAKEFPALVSTIEKTINEYSTKYNFNVGNIPNLSQITERAVSISLGFFSNIFGLLSLILLSLYISLDWEKIKKFIHKHIPNGGGHTFDKIVYDLETYIGFWVKGQLILMFVIWVCSTVALYFLGNPFFFPLGLVAGLLEIVPIVGPLISTVLAVLVAYAYGGPNIALITLIVFYLIQVLENNFLVPKVMQKVSGFSPVLILLSFLVFSNFLGIVGAILAIPMLMLINILIKHLLTKNSGNNEIL